MSELNEYKRFFELLAQESGKIVKQYFKSDYQIESKQDSSPVTIADKKSEEIIRSLISKEFPSHGIIGEEFGETNSGAEYSWMIDPIDGTKSFIAGGFDFGTIIALSKNGVPQIGMIYQPILNELMLGDGKNTILNDRKVMVKDCINISEATFLTTDFFSVKKYQNFEKFVDLAGKAKLCRTWGNCYGYLLLAAGQAQIMMDPIMAVWDILPIIPIVQGAGGIITDYQGKDPLKAKSIIAAVPSLHKQVIDLLN